MLKNNRIFLIVLVLLLVIILLVAISFGAVNISLDDMASATLHYFQGNKPANIYEGVFLQIRLPRVFLCAITGAILAVSGVLMQGLFRNPIVEPGLIGTSAGAAFGASFVFVFASAFGKETQSLIGPMLVPLFAFGGGMLATFIVYYLSKTRGRISVINLLLVGIAVNAVALSGTGFMSYLARDPQARSISFWNLGTFTGASWFQFFIVTILAIPIFLFSLRDAKQLNVLILGEDEARYIGIDPAKLKRRIMITNTAMVAVATSFVGVIAFMGLIVPHLMRMIVGSDHRKLLPASMLAGAILLTIADMGARLLLAPAEIPIGIITSLVGAPIYIILLRGENILQKKGGLND